jgi:nucleotide-binding universal stress UspA family protein
MVIKDLIVHLDPGPNLGPRLEAAIGLALAFEARVVAFCPVVEPAASLIELPPERLFGAWRDAEADRTLAAAVARAAQAGITLETWRETAALERLPELFARRARHADLAIVGRPEAGPDAQGVGVPVLTETAFLGTGGPALVVPPGITRALPPLRVLVAWDGSREAARAVHDALPLLRRAREVSVLVADPERLATKIGEKPGADLAAHLARHGLPVRVEVVKSGGRPLGEILLAQVEEERADLLVMGGYAHARLRELVLGGTTRHVLTHASVPVLLSH